jgi:hypothetical protein
VPGPFTSAKDGTGVRILIILTLTAILAGCGHERGLPATTTTLAPTTTTGASVSSTTSRPPITSIASQPGLVWTRIRDAAVLGGQGDQQMSSVTIGGPGLVAVGADASGGDEDAAVWVSADGFTWTRVQDMPALGGPGDQTMLSVTAGGPGLVAVGLDSADEDLNGAVWVSTDGYTWVRSDEDAVLGGPGLQYVRSVASTGEGLIAVGQDDMLVPGDLDGAVWLSEDGVTWSRLLELIVFGGPGLQGLSAVLAWPSGLVAVGLDGSGGDFDAAVWLSPDDKGFFWTGLNAPALGGVGDQGIMDVAAGGPGLVAVGTDGSGGDLDAAVWVSADGHTWTRVPHDESIFGGDNAQAMVAIAAAGTTLIAGGLDQTRNGTKAAVWTSADGYLWARLSDPSFDEAGAQEIASLAALGQLVIAVGSEGTTGSQDAAVWVGSPAA